MLDQQYKILVVDDSETARLNIEEAFSQIGCRVIARAEDGIQALQAIEREMPDLVSLDVIMPNMDGIEAFRRIRNLYPELKCILISVLCNEPKFREAYKSEISESLFIAKPVDRNLLEARLKELFAPANQPT